MLWAFALLGSLIAHLLGLPIPGSVIGMLLMWGALETGVIRLHWIQSGAVVLLAVLGLLFVPAGAGFVQFTGAGVIWPEVIGTAIVGCLISLAISGHVIQTIVRRRG